MILRIRGVKEVRSKGRTYFYHRKTMRRLPGLPGSREFIAELARLDEAMESGRPVVGSTLADLICAYRASAEFNALAPTTRQSYDRAFDVLEPSADRPLSSITRKGLYDLRDKVMALHKRAAANHVIKVLRLLFAWGVKRELCTENPATGVDKIRKPKDAPVINRPWRAEELAAMLEAAGPHLRLPLALAAYTGLRASDLVRVGWDCYDGRTFQTRTQKTGMPVWVPVHRTLRALLDAAPRGETIVLGRQGRPVTTSTLRNEFFALVHEMRAAGKIGPGLSIHGLRHTLGTALAEAGCDPPTIATVLGQATTAMAEHYSRSANRKKLATDAMRKLEQRDGRRPANEDEGQDGQVSSGNVLVSGEGNSGTGQVA